MDGNEIYLEFADVPVGDVVGGGGPRIGIIEVGDEMVILQYRGPGDFGGSAFTRIEADASPEVSPGAQLRARSSTTGSSGSHAQHSVHSRLGREGR